LRQERQPGQVRELGQVRVPGQVRALLPDLPTGSRQWLDYASKVCLAH